MPSIAAPSARFWHGGAQTLRDNSGMTPATVRLLTPRRLLMASIAVAVITITLKTLAWYVTDSVGLLSDAMESFVNLASAIFGLVMVTIAARPADEDHPYGHHKAEYFSSGFEGALIIAAAAGIIWAAGHRLFDPQPIEQVGWGLALSVASSALNGLLAWVMFRSAKEHRSIALEADAKHLVTDVWTSVGVIVGIALVYFTGWLWLDPVVALLVAANIVFAGRLTQTALAHYYARARVHVLPSWFETCGLSSLEAAAMGCNIVITAKGYPRDYFGDEASIREAVMQAATTATPMQLANSIKTNYTWERAAAMTLSAYQTVLHS